MEPTVLAGPIQFSPAEIALILAVITASALVLAAPGWVALAFVVGRRAPAGSSARRRAAAWAGGALLGIAVSGGVGAVVAALLDGSDHSVLGMVAAAWVSCWALALALHRLRPPAPAAPGHASSTGAGWGR
ncbi:MAG TPA: hypothetical protein VF423_03815 [Actinomycetes bacterium]